MDEVEFVKRLWKDNRVALVRRLSKPLGCWVVAHGGTIKQKSDGHYILRKG